MEIAEQLCPACGCSIVGTGYEAEGVVYCGEPCTRGRPCECGCCVPGEAPEE